jgi:outer membrane immunogenic protein
MKRLFVACGLLAAAVSAGPSAAADLPPSYRAPYAPPPVYSPIYRWAGFYIGINGGGNWGRSQWDGLGAFEISGGMVGATLGYNWQFQQLVAGIEGDVDWTGTKGSTNTLCPLGCETRNHWLSTVRGRVGYAFDRFLPYLTAGFAIGDIAATIPAFPGGTITTAGWTVGAGLEVGIVSNVSLKAEYLFVDLGSFNCGFNCALVGNGNVSFYTNVFRGGLNVRF